MLVFTKNEKAHKLVSKQFEERKVEKIYQALVHGTPKEEIGLVDLPILQTNSKKGLIVSQKGKECLTKYRILQSWGTYSHLEIKLLTGRQHQIRVHMKAIGCPLLCDKLYGNGLPFYLSSIKPKMKLNREVEERPLLSRQALHASSLAFKRLGNEDVLKFESELPKDMRAVIKQMNKCL